MKRKLILATLIISLVAFTAGCNNIQDSEPTDSPSQVEDNDTVDDDVDKDDSNKDNNDEDVANDEPEEPKETIVIGDVSFEILEISELSSNLQQAFGFINEHRGYGIVLEDGKDIIVFIGTGEKPTAGYDFHLKTIEKTSDGINITIVETQPKKDEMVAEVLTYPAKFIRITTDSRNINVQTEDGDILKDINAERS